MSNSTIRLPSLHGGLIKLYFGKAFPLLLAFLVLGWGTSYKLSLYSSDASAAVTPAKLCTRASDTAKTEFDRATELKAIEQATLLPAFFAIVIPEPLPFLKREQDGLNTAAPPWSSHYSSSVYRRPPPFFLSLVR